MNARILRADRLNLSAVWRRIRGEVVVVVVDTRVGATNVN